MFLTLSSLWLSCTLVEVNVKLVLGVFFFVINFLFYDLYNKQIDI